MNTSEKNLLQRLGNAVYALIFAAALILLLIAVFALKDNPVGQNFILNLAAGLVQVALVYYLVDRVFGFDPQKRQQDSLARLVTQLNKNAAKAQNDVNVLPSRMSIYETAINTIQGECWREVRIFAPVGLWREDEYKAEWLKELASHLHQGKVESVSMVYGLPPTHRDSERRPMEAVKKELAYARKILGLFDGQKNATIRFYPPTHASVGFGALIFQRSDLKGETAFALCSHSYEDLVDNGFSTDNDQVFVNAVEWFDKRIFNTAVKAFVLQNESKSISQTWTGVIEAWYGKAYLQS